MTRFGMVLSAGLVALAGVSAGASSPSAMDDDFVVRGCVTDANAPSVVAPSTFVWSRSDIMLAAAEARSTAVPLRERIFYWLEDDEDLTKHRGQRVEITGELKDFEKGKIEVDRKDDYTKVKLHLDGKTEEAKVPSSWLNEWASAKDQKFDIVARRIDVKKVKVLGACAGS
jgi:hypothetical protein